MEDIETVGLIINRYKEDIVEVALQAKFILNRHQVDVVAIGEEAEAMGIEPVTEEEFQQRAQLVLVIGGDGTMLRAARAVFEQETPILGINQGHLGFLTEIEVDCLEESLVQFLEGEHDIEHRMMLTARVYRENECIAEVNALNDLVLTKGALSRIIKLELYLDGRIVERYYGDGLIFSTPTGSTGYSLSAGGPVVQPEIDLCIVSPICPHSLIARPLIFSPDHTLTVRFASNYAPAMLTVDGQNGVELKRGDWIEIEKAKYDTALVVLKKKNFFSVLRSKLKAEDE